MIVYRKSAARIALVLLAGASLAACATLTPKYAVRERGSTPPPANGQHGTMAPYQVGGIWYVPKDQPDYDQTGIASWYGDAFNMKATADGEVFDMNQFSAAHTTLPLPSMVEVTNLDNGRKLVVRVNDRGPFVDNRLIDLSRAAAAELGYDRKGLAHVRVRYVGPAPLAPPNAGVRYADARQAPLTGSALPPAIIGAPTAAPSPAPITTKSLPPPAPISIAALPPAAPAEMPPAAMPAVSPSAPAVAAASPVQLASNSFRIQAGAFSDQANAQRVVSQLAPAGKATIEPLQRNGMTLYRVVLPGPSDEAEAYALRDRVAQIGFADARVVGPS